MEMPMRASKKAGNRRRKPAAVRLCACGVAVDAEERAHLVRACAFFRADRFRDADPRHLRAQDRADVTADIDAVLGGRKRPLSATKSRRQARRAGNG
jgi:hypothetical protein